MKKKVSPVTSGNATRAFSADKAGFELDLIYCFQRSCLYLCRDRWPICKSFTNWWRKK